MAKFHPKRLLVEGDDDKRVIPELMDKDVVWGEKKSEAVVLIESFDGVEQILKAGVLEAELNISNLEAIGIVIDADDQRDKRWSTLSRQCRDVIPDFPIVLPGEGLIHIASSGLRVGVWTMPDNESAGMLETFLSAMVPFDHDPLWAYARQVRAEAKNHGATHSDAHCDKANIHTFLAWVDPPGQQLHIAVLHKSLDARTPLGLRFARWFVELFQIPPRDPVVLEAALDPTPG